VRIYHVRHELRADAGSGDHGRFAVEAPRLIVLAGLALADGVPEFA
jgi:hypothetical protein